MCEKCESLEKRIEQLQSHIRELEEFVDLGYATANSELDSDDDDAHRTTMALKTVHPKHQDNSLRNYHRKCWSISFSSNRWYGSGRLAYPFWNEWIVAFVGGFLGIGLLGLMVQYRGGVPFPPVLIGSLGSTAVLVYGLPNAEAAQPYNAVVGNVVSAIMGVCAASIFPQPHLAWLAGALAVACAIVAMHLLKAMHPPGGATALIAVLSPEARSAGFLYVVSPVCFMFAFLVLVGLLTNNFSTTRRYPTNWI